MSQLSVKSLDNYSQTYLACAQKWQEKIEGAQGQSSYAALLMQQVRENRMDLNGKPCPALTKVHQTELQARITQATQ